MEHARPNSWNFHMRLPTIIPSIVLCLAAHAGAVEQGGAAVTKEGVPGGTFVKTVETTGTVTAIDAATRVVVLRLENGRESKVTVGPEAANFAQVKVGDVVRLGLTEQLVVGMADAANPPKDEVVGVVGTAPAGAQPGGVVAKTVTATATVTAIDEANRLATVTFADGSSKILRVRPDIDLKARKVGEKVVFKLTEAIAISVEKAAAK